MPTSVEAYAEQASSWQTTEYALSMNRLHAVGHLALAETVDPIELINSQNQLRAEFETSLSEMLKSDAEFGKELEITRFESYDVVQGRTVSHDRVKPVVTMLQDGYDVSAAGAQEDLRMVTQATRDWWDLQNAHEVDTMVSGKRGYNTRIVASLLPEEAIERDGEEYWRSMGYFPDTKTAFFQLYHVTEDGSLLTGTLSVDAADKDSMRKLWAAAGVKIPEGESTDNWLQYAITDTLTTEQAKALVVRLRQKHYENVNHVPTKPTSIEEVLAVNVGVMEQSFRRLHLPLSESLARGEKTEPIRRLVEGFLQNSHQFDTKARAELIRTCNRKSFDDADGRVVYKLIMYATAEEIRKSLPLAASARPDLSSVLYQETERRYTPGGYVSQQLFVNQIIQSALEGVSAKRSYGACGSSIQFGSNEMDRLEANLNPQAAFGGKAGAEEAKPKDDEDQYGPLTFECTEGHTNRRPRGKLIDKCQHRGCKGSVGCG